MALITHATMEADLRLALTLDERLYYLLEDQADIRTMAGAVSFLGMVNDSGSDTHAIRYAALGGADPFVATAAEDTDVADTAVADASVNIAVVRNSLARGISDLGTVTGFAQDLNPSSLAADMAKSYARLFQDLVATAIATAATNVGTGGVNMSVDDWYDALFTLSIADNDGPYFAMLAPIQHTDFIESLRAEGGALQFQEATGDQLALKGQGFQGTFLGVNVFKSSRVTTAAGNREGAMWSGASASLNSPGALGYKTAQLDARSFLGTAELVVQQGEVTVSIQHTFAGGETRVAGDAYVGLALLEQAKIVGIVTDA